MSFLLFFGKFKYILAHLILYRVVVLFSPLRCSSRSTTDLFSSPFRFIGLCVFMDSSFWIHLFNVFCFCVISRWLVRKIQTLIRTFVHCIFFCLNCYVPLFIVLWNSILKKLLLALVSFDDKSLAGDLHIFCDWAMTILLAAPCCTMSS